MDDFNRDKVDEIVLALLQLTLHDFYRAWKGFDWETLDRLYEKGWIENPRSKAKSVVILTRNRGVVECGKVGLKKGDHDAKTTTKFYG